jgi:membrane-bound ClpP family serine protease
MPIAIVLLDHPAGVYAFLVIAVSGLLHGCITRRFLQLLMGVAATLLTALAFATRAPEPAGALLIVLGAVLMNIEFRLATFGVAGLGGCAAAFAGSLGVLATARPEAAPPSAIAACLAAIGTLALLLAAYRTQRWLAFTR